MSGHRSFLYAGQNRSQVRARTIARAMGRAGMPARAVLVDPANGVWGAIVRTDGAILHVVTYADGEYGRASYWRTDWDAGEPLVIGCDWHDTLAGAVREASALTRGGAY